MKLEFVNHASYVLDSDGVRLICDPWLEGTAFNNGWALLPKTGFGYQDFATITHLWFSHEHPDHFSPPNLKKIPPEHRQRITVLYQKTQDKKVVGFCAKLGFREVRELEPDQWHALSPGVKILCNPHPGFQDSWSCVSTPEGRLLNINDCWIVDRATLSQIKNLVGDVDVLATQFSVSAWDGNADQGDRLRQGARAMLEKAVTQCQVFAPRYVLPFASFIFFCHQDNAYMNQAFLGMDEIAEALRTRTRAVPIVMYPGDRWTVGEPFATDQAVARYKKDQESVATRSLIKSESVPADTLIKASHEFCQALVEGSDRTRVKIRWVAESFRQKGRAPSGRSLPAQLRRLKDLLMFRIEPAKIYVTDHEAAYLFHPELGLSPASLRRDQCDVILGSESLHYAFKFLWGGQTLAINGRFQEGAPGARRALFQHFDMAGNRSAGQVVTWKDLPRQLSRRVEGLLARRSLENRR